MPITWRMGLLINNNDHIVCILPTMNFLVRQKRNERKKKIKNIFYERNSGSQ